MLRFLLDAEAVPFVVEFGHSITFRIVDPIAEHSGFALLFGCLNAFLKDSGEA